MALDDAATCSASGRSAGGTTSTNAPPSAQYNA